MSTSTSAGTTPDLKRAIGPRLLLLFIVGDILGTGVYALTGEVAGEVGGAGWAAILLAFGVATVTAFSYLELVTKYPQAAGAALYTHKAFGVHVLTFLVTFAVLSSGLTSASTAAKFLAENVIIGFGLDWGQGAVTMIALTFITLLAAINLRGVAESLAANVVLTLVELTGLLVVILIGFWAMSQGNVDLGRAMVFATSEDKTVFLALTSATALAFFSMVGFEDSVNMAEETKDPVRVFPRVMLTGLSLTALIYVLVSITAVAVVPVGELAASQTPLLEVVRRGAPGLPVDTIYPFLSIFAVANTALINLMMASRLVYGMARHEVLPPLLGRVLPGRRSPWAAIVFTTLLAYGLVWGVTQVAGEETVTALGGTTALLLLAVFTVVNVAAIVLRRRPVEREHFHAPTVLPYIGAVTCAFLVGPWAQEPLTYQIAGGLIAIGLLLWLLTWALYRRGRPLPPPDQESEGA
ncbi:APC family permease [Georgenia satyanarayanai]|uniref:APC family permease n=1 Tax=Georgenia satyanarayanai TaxID=860221 RepID=UPI0012645BF0|nr:APC family permease [Georgenia satyanarayanai]